MAYKLIVECEVCGQDYKVAARRSRSRRRADEWIEDGDTSVTFNFNLMTEKEKEQVDGNMYGAELYFDTVCKPCRESLYSAVRAVISDRKPKKTRKAGKK
jgi:hypothetical protein